jgi:hypothetical protein
MLFFRDQNVIAFTGFVNYQPQSFDFRLMVQSCKFQRVIEIHLYIAVGALLPSPGHPHLRMAQKDFTQAQRRIVARWSVTPTSQASEGQRHEPFHETVGLSPHA